MSTELRIRVNGVHAAWPAFLGCDDAHCEEVRRDPYRVAHTSYSLLQYEGGRLMRHTLVDVGLGVIESLLEFERVHGLHVVHELLVTHPHFDHLAQLEWLAMSVEKNGRSDQPRPLAVYCSSACWQEGPARVFPRVVRKGLIEHRPIEDGRAFELGDLRITPAAVRHSESAPGAVGFIVEPMSDGAPRKIILTGDFRAPADPANPIWQGADVCFTDANTWNPTPGGDHQSVMEAIEWMRRWRTRRTYLIHYSGHGEPVDAPRGARAMTGAELASAVDASRGELDIRVARHGMILPADEPWP